MIKPINIIDSYRIKQVDVKTLNFDLPLSYFNDKFPGKTIQVAANLVQKYDSDQISLLPSKPKIIAFLQGGPGFECSFPPNNLAYTNVFIEKGYQVLYMDQRGTGLSTPLNAKSIKKLVPDYENTEKLVGYFLNFTAASIIEDLERIRYQLIGDDKWSIVGQSYGGFCSFTYLSHYPDSIKESFITAGVPPVNHGPDDVYTATYKRSKERNAHFYKKYPQDIVKVKTILKYLKYNKVTLPDSGNLSVERFQQLGQTFGGKGGTDNLHSLITHFDNDLKLYGEPNYKTLLTVQTSISFDSNIMYALFQESIYCDGNNHAVNSSNWSAERLRYSSENFQFVYDENSEEPTYFTGEMVFKSMYDDYVELRPFKKLAYALHANTVWPKLYDTKVLKKLTFKDLPIVGSLYYNDLYVDFELSTKVIKDIFEGRNFRTYVTSQYFHSGARDDPNGILGTLFNLLESEID